MTPFSLFWFNRLNDFISWKIDGHLQNSVNTFSFLKFMFCPFFSDQAKLSFIKNLVLDIFTYIFKQFPSLDHLFYWPLKNFKRLLNSLPLRISVIKEEFSLPVLLYVNNERLIHFNLKQNAKVVPVCIKTCLSNTL